ncbi:MAG: hypothetical protein K2I80_03100 [Ruminococcus sp.]|nr:hypothetical protein [Ruminococcus sp.]
MSESLNIDIIEALTLIHLKSLDSSELSSDKIVDSYFNAYKKINEAYTVKKEEFDKENASNFGCQIA